MEDRNNVTEFILLELSMDKKVQILCFLFFLFCYLAIWLGNLIIVISITCSQLITQPMYFFLNCLALSDLFYTSTVTFLPVHGDGVVERFADGHIAVTGHPCEDEDLNPPKKCVLKSCVMQFL